jgi:hypothetical protein
MVYVLIRVKSRGGGRKEWKIENIALLFMLLKSRLHFLFYVEKRGE